MKNNEGFTLLEIMIVVVIIGILSTMAALRLSDMMQRGKVYAAVIGIRQLQQVLEDFYQAKGFYPSAHDGLDLLTWDNSESNGKSGRDYARLKKIPKDPWGNPYIYIVPGLENEPYGIISLGRDSKQGGAGWNKDIVSWNLENSSGGLLDEKK